MYLVFWFVFLQNLIGEWTPVEGAEIQGPAKDNAVLGHIIHRLFNIVSPPEVFFLFCSTSYVFLACPIFPLLHSLGKSLELNSQIKAVFFVYSHRRLHQSSHRFQSRCVFLGSSSAVKLQPLIKFLKVSTVVICVDK